MKVRPPKPAQSVSQTTTTTPQAKGMLVQWFPQWWGWYSAKAPSSSSPTTAIAAAPGSSTFDGELLDVLADTIDDDTLLRRDTVFGLFNFALSKGAISLCTVVKGETGWLIRVSPCRVGCIWERWLAGYELSVSCKVYSFLCCIFFFFAEENVGWWLDKFHFFYSFFSWDRKLYNLCFV